MITPYVPLVLRENLEKVGNPRHKKKCRERICVSTTWPSRPKVPTFGCRADMSPTCRRLSQPSWTRWWIERVLVGEPIQRHGLRRGASSSVPSLVTVSVNGKLLWGHVTRQSGPRSRRPGLGVGDYVGLGIVGMGVPLGNTLGPVVDGTGSTSVDNTIGLCLTGMMAVLGDNVVGLGVAGMAVSGAVIAGLVVAKTVVSCGNIVRPGVTGMPVLGDNVIGVLGGDVIVGVGDATTMAVISGGNVGLGVGSGIDPSSSFAIRYQYPMSSITP